MPAVASKNVRTRRQKNRRTAASIAKQAYKLADKLMGISWIETVESANGSVIGAASPFNQLSGGFDKLREATQLIQAALKASK